MKEFFFRVKLSWFSQFIWKFCCTFQISFLTKIMKYGVLYFSLCVTNVFVVFEDWSGVPPKDARVGRVQRQWPQVPRVPLLPVDPLPHAHGATQPASRGWWWVLHDNFSSEEMVTVKKNCKEVHILFGKKRINPEYLV